MLKFVAPLVFILALLLGTVAVPPGTEAAAEVRFESHARVAPDLDYGTATIAGAPVHILTARISSGKVRVRPFVSEDRSTTQTQAAQAGCLAAVNAGYFNMSDGVSTSFVTIGGEQVCDPRTNKALIENPRLKPFLEQIFNRSEIRFLQSEDGTISASISAHDAPVPGGKKIVDAMQGGPQLLPEITSVPEAFIRDESGKMADSIGTAARAARTAIGINKRGDVIIVCVAGGKKREFQRGVNLKTMAEIMSRLGCISALNLDGGTSTTMVVARSGKTSELEPVCSWEPQREVKSIIGIVKP
ncbi:MAG: phosphodiester glycosidase family protein [Cyanobacteria bacterium HKST-UBA02]|nr:phosphodiester glycosidase family protein [Cyanobacteria bacterium HKST-UBA02]